jgi:hypothetical protein
MKPGATVFTVMPNGASSRAQARVSPTCALLAVAADDVADGGYLLVAGRAVDRDGEAVTGQAPRDHRPQAPRAAGHQSDTSLRYRHVVMISPPTRQADPTAIRPWNYEPRNAAPVWFRA